MDANDKRTAEQMIEDGVGLIARGMFRKGDKAGDGRPFEAYEAGMSATSVIRGMAFDFLKQHQNAKINSKK